MALNAFNPAFAGNSLSEALAKPLITGASVSADFSSLSPGKKLALRYDKKADIRTVAQGGTPGVELLRRVKPQTFEGRTSVIAVDLFFWDSTRADAGSSIQALQGFVKEVAARKIPLVLGEIPPLLPSRQPSREKLNRALHDACAGYSLCSIMPFEELYRKVERDGYLEIRGKKYSLFEMVPDGLHLAGVAGDFLADVLEGVMKAKLP